MTEPSKPFTDEELTALEDLCNAATEGPWTLDERRVGKRNGIQRLIANNDICQPVSLGDDYGDNNRANILFAAAAREAMPRMIAMVRELQPEVGWEEIKARIDKVDGPRVLEQRDYQRLDLDGEPE